MNEAQMAVHLSNNKLETYNIACAVSKRAYATPYFDVYTYPIYIFKDGSVLDFSIAYEDGDDIDVIAIRVYESIKECELERIMAAA